MNPSGLSRIAGVINRLDQRSIEELTDYLHSNDASEPVFIWTINLSHLREFSRKNLEFEFLNSNCLMVADGWPVRTLSALLTKRHVNRIPGVDIVEVLLLKGINFGVIGSSEDQLSGTLSRTSFLSKSNLDFHFEENIDLNKDSHISKIAELISLNPTKFIFLALGFPKQELLFDILKSKQSLSPGYYLGIGGSFEMLSGQKIRAPKLIQSLGLEWSWRFSQDPRRLYRRYILDCIFFGWTLLSIPISKIMSKIPT